MMQRQLEGLKRKWSLEENKSAAAEEELDSVANQLALVNKQLKYEQGQRKAAELGVGKQPEGRKIQDSFEKSSEIRG